MWDQSLGKGDLGIIGAAACPHLLLETSDCPVWAGFGGGSQFGLGLVVAAQFGLGFGDTGLSLDWVW